MMDEAKDSCGMCNSDLYLFKFSCICCWFDEMFSSKHSSFAKAVGKGGRGDKLVGRFSHDV